MIKCPSCSHENVDGTTFCEMCGEELEPSAGLNDNPPSATVVNGGAVAASGGDIKCPACENLNPADNVVCEVCGTELRPGADAATASVSTQATTTDAPPVAPDTTPATSDAASTPDAIDTSATTIDPGIDPSAGASTPTADTATDTPATSDAASATSDAAATTDADVDTPSTPGAELKPGQVKLVVEQGMNVGKQFVLGDEELLVGREDEEEEIYPDIDLSDQDEGFVHRKHATLKFENGQLSVTHLGGANKSRVNNKPILDNQPQPVKLGDKIAFGKVVLRVLPHSAG